LFVWVPSFGEHFPVAAAAQFGKIVHPLPCPALLPIETFEMNDFLVS
jgi:hypothetical protein